MANDIQVKTYFGLEKFPKFDLFKGFQTNQIQIKCVGTSFSFAKTVNYIH